MFRTLTISTTLLLALAATAPTAGAVLLYGKDNSGNTSDPGAALPWGNVAEIVNSGGGAITGTAVYIGDGFLLTADHLTLRSHVSFDGVTLYAVDGGYGAVPIGPADLKLFRIVADPGLAAIALYDGSAEVSELATIVGWGVGRDPMIATHTNSVDWGDDTTVDKRWGTNLVAGSTPSLDAGGYIYSALITVQSNANGDDEGALTTHDSGAALFVDDGGTWKLAGIATSTESPAGTTVFGTDSLSGGGTENYFVRISTYRALIELTMPVELESFRVE